MGRIDDVLNVSGHRLGTMEIESALVSHPAVAEGVGMEYASPEQVLGFEMPQNGASVDGAGATAARAMPGSN